MTLGLLEAPGEYGCQLAIGEGQSAGNPLAYGGPHYGFVASKIDHVRRLAGANRGPDGRYRRPPRVRADAADARAAHPPREGHVEHHHQPDVACAVRARVPVVARTRRACATSGRRVCRCRSTPRPRSDLEPGVRPPHRQGVRGAHQPAGGRGGGRCPEAGGPSRLRARRRVPRHGGRAAGGGHRAALSRRTSTVWRRCCAEVGA